MTEALKYDFTLDLNVKNNSHTQLLQRVPKGSKVLELGCATGYMSRILKQSLACHVVGLELDEAAAQLARDHCDRVIQANVEDLSWLDEVRGETFDVITCADLIEHLLDPLRLLRALVGLLTEQGVLLVSIPNGAHVSIRLELLEGRLTFEDTGLLDRTHLHFFTHASIRQMLSDAGYFVADFSYTFQDVPDHIIAERLRRVGLQATPNALAALHAPDAVAYQFILAARRRGENDAPQSGFEIHDSPLLGSLEYLKNLLSEHEAVQRTAQTRQLMIEERDQALAAQHQVVQQKDEQLTQLHEVAVARQAIIEQKQDELKGLTLIKDQVQTQHDGLAQRLQQMNEHLLELTQIVAARDATIDEQVASLENYFLNITNFKAVVAAQEEVIAKRDAQLRQWGKEREVLQAQAAHLHDILHSTGWRVWLFLMYPLRLFRRVQPFLSLLFSEPDRALKLLNAYRLRRREGGWKSVWHRLRHRHAPRYPALEQDLAYQHWLAHVEPAHEVSAYHINDWLAMLAAPLRLSVLMPAYNTPEAWLREAVESLLRQSYPFWELCVVDDASTQPQVRRVLEWYAAKDRRVKPVFRSDNGHIAAASNSALEQATGDYIVLMDHDDLLSPNALYYLAKELSEHPGTQLVYSDEDKLSEDGCRFAHYFKPDYNPDLMLSHNMICHLAAYRTRLVRELGGFRAAFNGAQDYDLALRVLQRCRPDQVRHIPRILYHWRAVPQSTAAGVEAKPYAVAAAAAAVTDYLEKAGQPARVSESEFIEGMLRVRYALPAELPLVSIIIPTRNGLELIRRCIESIEQRSDYRRFEIIVVDNASDDPELIAYLADLQQASRIRLLHYDQPFNYSAINNFAVQHAEGEYLAFLNNDLEVIAADWLGEMVSHAQRDRVGAVGARLLYPDGRVQHGGVVLGLGGVAGHAMKYFPRDDKGYNARLVLIQNYSAVTAACLLIRREVFDQVKGFDEKNLPVAFNDVDFCLRVREAGYDNVWTPYAELYHHESATRGPEDTADKQQRFSREIDYMRKRWRSQLAHDPAYNPNLTRDMENFALTTH